MWLIKEKVGEGLFYHNGPSRFEFGIFLRLGKVRSLRATIVEEAAACFTSPGKFRRSKGQKPTPKHVCSGFIKKAAPVLIAVRSDHSLRFFIAVVYLRVRGFFIALPEWMAPVGGWGEKAKSPGILTSFLQIFSFIPVKRVISQRPQPGAGMFKTPACIREIKF